MDTVDRKILMLLQQNAKYNTKEIADKIGLSVSPTYERIKKLEQKGYIESYVAILNKKLIGKTLTVYCQISLTQHSRKLIDNFKKKITSIEEVMTCLHVSGNYDFLIKVSVNDMNEYQDFVINKLSTLEGISNVQSSFVIDQLKNETLYNL